jgi:hypothetical protein
MSTILTHPSAVMEPEPLPASVPPKAGRPWYVRKLDADCHVRAIIAVLEAADTVLGIVDPSRKPSTYRELAEESLGRLDPHVRAVAEFRAAETMLAEIELHASGPAMSRMQRVLVIRQATAKALLHYQMTCEGRLPASIENARRVDATGRLLTDSFIEGEL